MQSYVIYTKASKHELKQSEGQRGQSSAAVNNGIAANIPSAEATRSLFSIE